MESGNHLLIISWIQPCQVYTTFVTQGFHNTHVLFTCIAALYMPGTCDCFIECFDAVAGTISAQVID